MLRYIVIFLAYAIFVTADTLNIAIDIGHSPLRGGCTSARGIKEYAYNRKTALVVYYALREAGINAFFVNADEKEISLLQRTEVAHRYGATHFISIHHDSVKEQLLSKWKYKGRERFYCDNFYGFSLFVSKKNKYFAKSIDLATRIGSYLIINGLRFAPHHAMDIRGERKELIDRRYGIYRFDNLVVLKKNRIPALLIECGVIINRDDELRADSLQYRKIIGQAVVWAFMHSYSEGSSRYANKRD